MSADPEHIRLHYTMLINPLKHYISPDCDREQIVQPHQHMMLLKRGLQGL